jgi:hypothetical protein
MFERKLCLHIQGRLVMPSPTFEINEIILIRNVSDMKKSGQMKRPFIRRIKSMLCLMIHRAMKVCRGGGIAPSILNLVIRWRLVTSFTPRKRVPDVTR